MKAPAHNVLSGIGFALFAVACFAAMAVVGISGALGAWPTLKESRVPVTLPES